MTAAQWQEVLCRVRNLSASDKERLLTYLHDAAQRPSNAEGTPEYTQGTVTAPPGYQRALQALFLPSQPGKFRPL